MKKALATFAFIALAATANAQILAWDFTGANGSEATSSADTSDANLDSSLLLSRGAGAAGSVGANSFRTTGFQNNGISTANTDFFQFELSGDPGQFLSLSTIDTNFAGTATYSASPGASMQFAYSLDGVNFTLIGSPFARIGNGVGTQVDLTGIGDLQNMADTTTVTFRMYATGQTSTGGWGYASNTAATNGLAVGGSFTPVPEPSSIGLIGLGLAAVLLRFRASRKS